MSTAEERVTASRAAQGLGPKVTDPVVLREIAVILVEAELNRAGRNRVLSENELKDDVKIVA